jgi:hypothetical protein
MDTNLGSHAPDQLEDDRQFERWHSEWGEQERMARLMGVSRATFGRQVKSADDQHPCDYHRGRRYLYAAGYRGDEKGLAIKAGFDEAYQAGVRDRLGEEAEVDITDNELNAAWYQFLAAKSAYEAGRLSADRFDDIRNQLVVTLGHVRTGARVMSAGEREREARFSG